MQEFIRSTLKLGNVPVGKPSNDDRAGVYLPLYERIKLY